MFCNSLVVLPFKALREVSFIMGGGLSICRGPKFLGYCKGRAKFGGGGSIECGGRIFLGVQEGVANAGGQVFRVPARGEGLEKIDDRLSQIESNK